MRRIIIALLLSVVLVACDEDENKLGDFAMNIVTYESTDADGMARFSFQTRDDLPVQKIAAYGVSLDKAEAGQRCLMRYTSEYTLLDGTRVVRADNFSLIPTDKARTAPHSDMDNFPETEISVTSLWRSGEYINLNGWVPYSGKNYQLMLVADESTVDDATVVARIVYNTMGETTMFDRRVYASFNVSSLWKKSTLKRLQVGIGERTFTFEK